MELIAQVNDEIGLITLNRPSTRNAICKGMWDALPYAIDEVKEKGAKVVVFAGEGLAFASGADLLELQALDSEEKARALWLSISGALNTVATCHLPTIAMIHGPCMGGGCLLALACDIRICESAASFCIPVAQLGIVLDEDNIARLISLVGKGHACEMLLTAAVIDAQHAEQIGLVNRVVPRANLRQSAMSTAQTIKGNAFDAVVQSKRAIASLSARGVGDQDQKAIIASYLSEEFRNRLKRALGKGRS